MTRWFQGPAFLWELQSNWKKSSAQIANQNGTSDFEWKKQIKVSSVIRKEDFVSGLEDRCSCWLKLKRVIPFILRWKVNQYIKQSMLIGKSRKVAINFANENLHILERSRIQ